MIPFNDFKAHYADVRNAVEPAVQRVLESAWYVLGNELGAFEAAFAAYLGHGEAVGVASGTDAIALALMACGVGPGDEVITTNMTAYPTITGIKQTGATPVVVDIVPETGLIDLAQIPAHISKATRAIVPVHLYGRSCDMPALMALADAHGLAVVEDCAQAVGALCNGRAVGSWGRFGCYSFYPTKNLGAFGDGGAVLARDGGDDTERLRRLRNYGQSRRYYHDDTGINSRLDEMQAAILSVKLPLLDGWTQRRRAIAARYYAELDGVETLRPCTDDSCVHHLFPLLIDGRDGFIERMAAAGVATLIHYPVPIHRQRDFGGQQNEAFPVTDAFADRIVSIPIYPELAEPEVDQICRAVNACAGG
jgi:dTDP-4-amino-4,6-dideoxygalactose transaminase